MSLSYRKILSITFLNCNLSNLTYFFFVLKKLNIGALPNRSPTPIWLVSKQILLKKIKPRYNPFFLKVSTKYLSPLIAVYDERIKEKDEKLKLLKVCL